MLKEKKKSVKERKEKEKESERTAITWMRGRERKAKLGEKYQRYQAHLALDP